MYRFSGISYFHCFLLKIRPNVRCRRVDVLCLRTKGSELKLLEGGTNIYLKHSIQKFQRLFLGAISTDFPCRSSQRNTKLVVLISEVRVRVGTPNKGVTACALMPNFRWFTESEHRCKRHTLFIRRGLVRGGNQIRKSLSSSSHYGQPCHHRSVDP